MDRPPADRGGKNYGWNRLEGSHACPGAAPANAVPPVIEYSHDGGACTVIGGFVYRGRAGWIDAVTVTGGGVRRPLRLPVTVPNLSSFGTDGAGELYAMSTDGQLSRFAAA